MSATSFDGSIRKLWLADLPAFRAHLLRLDAHARYQRFAMAASDDFVRGYAETSFSIDTLIHGYFDGSDLRGVGELRMVGPAKLREAEAAFSVEAVAQAHGVGSALLQRTLLAARNRGIRRLYMTCLASNRSMQQLARRFGAELEFDSGDVTGLMLPNSASPTSLFKEAVNDGYGWATAVFDLQRAMLKTG